MAASWGRGRATQSGPPGCVSTRREVKGLEDGSLTGGGRWVGWAGVGSLVWVAGFEDHVR